MVRRERVAGRLADSEDAQRGDAIEITVPVRKQISKSRSIAALRRPKESDEGDDRGAARQKREDRRAQQRADEHEQGRATDQRVVQEPATLKRALDLGKLARGDNGLAIQMPKRGCGHATGTRAATRRRRRGHEDQVTKRTTQSGKPQRVAISPVGYSGRKVEETVARE